ncbi:hypothetical protein ZHAS_00000204 [Anopheles sinensis]|uniref:Uncharacterized protein n=1 Tax=Anopheles sinensis TaxID=74873 RepID=A0A084VA05_ANOSI|nr:hypothetical protein ZHAS_00000204 [Anopheles sinensis]
MAAFDFKTINAFVPSLDGKPENVKMFVKAIKIAKELAKDNELMLVRVLETKLTGKAAQTMSEDVMKVDEFIVEIKKRFEEKTDPLKVIAAIEAIRKTNNKTIGEEIELLTYKLMGNTVDRLSSLSYSHLRSRVFDLALWDFSNSFQVFKNHRKKVDLTDDQ